MIASLSLFLPLLSWAGASVVALYALRRGQLNGDRYPNARRTRDGI